MFNNKYSKTLTIILIIVIVIILGLLIFFGINVYKKYYIKQAATNAIEEFDNKIIHDEENQNSIDNTIILNDLIGDIDLNTLYQNTGSGNSSSNKPGTGVTYMGYDVIGYIEIPATDIKYPIIPDYQSSINSLNVAIVMLYPSNKGLNEIGNTVLAGHNYRDGTFFSNNKRLQNGDKIYITDTSGNKVTYEVYKKYETAANEATYMNRDTEGRREISLTTCTDDTKQRLIIWAKEV